MNFKTTSEYATRAEAEELAERIIANSDPYRGVYDVHVWKVHGKSAYVVTYYVGSL